MENENERSHEKRFFASLSAKKKVLLAVIAFLLLIGFLSCRTAGHTRRFDGTPFMGAGNVALAAKDFEPVGIVHAEAVAFRRDGYATTYNALMKEASQKGADAVINVNISSTGLLFNKTWSGSALAIKYLDPVNLENGSSALWIPSGRGFGRNRF